MQRFWKLLASAGVVALFYVGHGLHQGLPGESVTYGQRRVSDGDLYQQTKRYFGLRKPKPAPPHIGAYQIIHVPVLPGEPEDMGIRRLNTATGDIDMPIAPGMNERDRHGFWQTLDIRVP